MEGFFTLLSGSLRSPESVQTARLVFFRLLPNFPLGPVLVINLFKAKVFPIDD
jgi:hypothetical protein